MSEICNMTEVSTSDLRPLIHEIRGVQVMLDKDLAALYGVPTKRLNEQVRRNIERFPEDFMFQMSAEECSRSQIATMKNGRGKNIKYLPSRPLIHVRFRKCWRSLIRRLARAPKIRGKLAEIS